jgi:hypothetical protein
MRTRLIFFIVAVLSITISPISLTSNAASTKLEILAITDTKPGEVEVTFLSKSSKSLITSYQIVAKPVGASGLVFSKSYNKKVSGYISQKVSPLSPGVDYIFTLTQRSVDKKVTRSTPYAYTTEPTSPGAPRITSALATDSDEAVIFFDAPKDDGGTPILSYTVTANPGQIITTSNQQVAGSITALGLTKATSYTFTITAQNLYGRSEPSLISPAVTTLAQKIVRSSPASTTQTNTVPPVAAPAFTLSSSSETGTVDTAATGFSISSTGGAIASFAISATPPGMSFSTSTGVLTGTPNTVASATTYTVTATNAAGSAMRTFTLTVRYIVGSTGPGGGKIFYVAATPFDCGPTRATTCTYLEAAPPALGLASFDSDTVRTTGRTWAQSIPVNYQGSPVNNSTSPQTATATQIGWGYRNTRAIILQGNTDTATSAAALADSHTVTVSGVVYDDWYLPSKDELNQMCKWVRGQAWTSDATVCNGTGTLNSATYGASEAGFGGLNYNSSTEYNGGRSVGQNFGNGTQLTYQKNQSSMYVRPVRAF